MPHSVTISTPAFELGNSYTEIRIMRDSSIIGRILMSRDGFDWYRPNAKHPTKSLTWQQLAEILDSEE